MLKCDFLNNAIQIFNPMQGSSKNQVRRVIQFWLIYKEKIKITYHQGHEGQDWQDKSIY